MIEIAKPHGFVVWQNAKDELPFERRKTGREDNCNSLPSMTALN